MGRYSLIRRMQGLARRHASDGALGLLFMAALAAGGASAWSGLRTVLEPVLPGAVAAPEPQARDSARLELFGFGAMPGHYTPQVLFPIQGHAMPDWLRVRLAAGLNLPPLLP